MTEHASRYFHVCFNKLLHLLIPFSYFPLNESGGQTCLFVSRTSTFLICTKEQKPLLSSGAIAKKQPSVTHLTVPRSDSDNPNRPQTCFCLISKHFIHVSNKIITWLHFPALWSLLQSFRFCLRLLHLFWWTHLVSNYCRQLFSAKDDLSSSTCSKNFVKLCEDLVPKGPDIIVSGFKTELKGELNIGINWTESLIGINVAMLDI